MSGVLQSIIMSSKATALPITYVNATNNQSSSSTNSLTINKPTNTSDGDLMILVIGGAFSGSNTWTFPSGWTVIFGSGSNSGPALAIGYKVASSEGSNYTITGTNNNKYGGAIFTYRNAAYDTVGTRSTNTTASSITVSNNNSVLLGIFMTNSANENFGTPNGFSTIIKDTDSNAPSYGIFSKSVNSGSTGTVTSSENIEGTINSVLMSIKRV